MLDIKDRQRLLSQACKNNNIEMIKQLLHKSNANTYAYLLGYKIGYIIVDDIQQFRYYHPHHIFFSFHNRLDFFFHTYLN